MQDDIINPLFQALGQEDDDDHSSDPTPPTDPTPPANPATQADPPAPPTQPTQPTEPAPPSAPPVQPQADPSITAFQMNRAAKKLESELVSEFGDLLTQDEIEKITEHIAASSNPQSFIEQVQQGIHKEYAKTVAFDKLKDRQRQGVSDPTPVGSQAPVRAGQEGAATIVADFERLYGKPTKAQADRLTRESK